ncbi:sulfotransferase family 2 domain-containing protein [Limimaricola pyoseonensis]|uniref:Sulfotransferase family protein n=1 Tax=Limimaricola pyoseonensis TaxID=521013 RepID=A0A1G7KIL6_9RHOB|nr:sulfotransferase family 2 domain-containing protein [Limimaricola pyoseonensis]SDF37093.1 Sulfotransferase family protein [Limimaricola pyoseonensis]
MTVVVFLHVPKTAGQTIHHQLAAAVGRDKVSPIRTHTQAGRESQLPPGYRLHSGHIDWTDLETLPQDRFVFTVLRDPRERIASFYFFLRREAERAAPGTPADRLRAKDWSTDDYFFGGDAGWQNFVRDHYDNFYCSYFASRRMRGRGTLSGLSPEEVVRRARAGLDGLDGIYWIDGLAALEADMRRLGLPVKVVGRRSNAGALPENQMRWPKLLDMFETDTARRRVEDFVDRDIKLLASVPRPVVGPAPGWRSRFLAGLKIRS